MEKEGFLDKLAPELSTRSRSRRWETLILCCYGGTLDPPFCEMMPRDPAPPVGFRVDENFADRVDAALALNAALHDGAMLLSGDKHGTYTVTGWSYRLFPPGSNVELAVNRGSAFNSCQLMSLVDRVQSMFLVSESSTFKFYKGKYIHLS